MPNLHYGPKIKQLSNKETLQSIESWKSIVLYGLRLNPEFKPYLDSEFGRKSRNYQLKQLTDDTTTTTDVDGKTEIQVITVSSAEKCEIVDLLLNQVANYASTVPRNDIVKESKSLKEVWTKIKLQYNQQQPGSLLNDCWNMTNVS